MKRFGPNYFRNIPKYGVGLGMNPSDAHDLYLEHHPSTIDYLEVTSTSFRLRGPDSYVEARRKKNLRNGVRYMRLDDYPEQVKRIVHSTNVNPLYPEPLTPQAYEELRRLVGLTNTPWVTEDLGIWLMNERHVYPFFLPMPMTKEALSVGIHNIHRFHEEVGVPFNAEFPPVRLVAGDMHAFDFFRILAEETGCGVCLDIGHVLSYQLEKGVSATADLHRLPWEYVTEIHLAGGGIDLHTSGFHYEDHHGDYDVVTVCFDMLDTVLAYAPNLKAITLEVFGARNYRGTIRRLQELKLRDSVAGWLVDLESESVLPDYESARIQVREAVVGMHDVLHSPDELSGETLARRGAAFLDLFAAEERRKWDYDREARIRLHGINLTTYFPLTVKWLLHTGRFASETSLFNSILKELPGHSVELWDKIHSVFKRFVFEGEQTDEVLVQLFEFEKWLNECNWGIQELETKSFSVNVVQLASQLNKGQRVAYEQVDRTHITLSHVGEGKIGVVSEAVLQQSEPEEPVQRGRNECCTAD